MKIRLYRPGDKAFLDLELPVLIGTLLYHRCAVVHYRDRVIFFAFRFWPLVLWRYLPRTWGERARPPLIDAGDWTGRDRELGSLIWDFTFRRWTVDHLERIRTPLIPIMTTPVYDDKSVIERAWNGKKTIDDAFDWTSA